MYCPECGHQNREVARFCARCGARLIEQEAGSEATMSFAPDAEDEQEQAQVERPAEMTGAVLVIRQGAGRAGEQFPVGRERTTLGRAPQADIFLDDITVSREHAALERRPDGVHLTDLGSLNGTYINRQRVESVRLADGGEVQVGKYRLTYLERP